MTPGQLKTAVRRLAVWGNRLLLDGVSRPLPLPPAPLLILAPHQDDETLACGSLIARHRHEGHNVHVIFLTDGGASHRGHPKLSASALVELRREEARAALRILCVDSACVEFWDLPDGTLNTLSAPDRAALITRLEALLGRVRPGTVLVPCCPDGSSEHDPVLGFVQDALRAIRQPVEIWQYPVWSWWNPVLLLSRILRPPGSYRQPGEDYHRLKTQALAQYRSQLEPLPPAVNAPLPPELREFCLHETEYFFRTNPPVPPA